MDRKVKNQLVALAKAAAVALNGRKIRDLEPEVRSKYSALQCEIGAAYEAEAWVQREKKHSLTGMVNTMLAAIKARQMVCIIYPEHGDGEARSRFILPVYVVENEKRFKVVAWDASRGAGRAFFLDKIEAAVCCEYLDAPQKSEPNGYTIVYPGWDVAWHRHALPEKAVNLEKWTGWTTTQPTEVLRKPA
jgi:predicted DNA-binding transcriptional regulator YafY